MDILSTGSTSRTREQITDYLRSSRERLLKGLADGTIVGKRLDPAKLRPVQISPAAQAAHDSGKAPLASGEFDVALLRAAAQRRLGRPFG